MQDWQALVIQAWGPFWPQAGHLDTRTVQTLQRAVERLDVPADVSRGEVLRRAKLRVSQAKGKTA